MPMRITVQTYAGYKGDERPVSFSREGRTFQIREIVDRWYDPDHNCFKVLADDGKTYLLRHDVNADGWELLEMTGKYKFMKKSFSPDDLPVVNGRIYHLDLAPEELAQHVIVVGDPDRVPLLADEFLVEREVDRSHRGFRSITGVTRETDMRVSIVTSGIGAPSTEIVLNELAALNEIDFRTMTRKESFEPLAIVRVGTSGGLNPATPLGTLVLTDYVIGLDNTGLFYDVPLLEAACPFLEEQARMALDRAAKPGARFRGTIVPYVARADRELLAALAVEASVLGITHAQGITVSSAGFFAEQGRGVARIGSTFHGLLDALDIMDTSRIGLKVENMEMEAGILLHFLAGLGYRAAAVCAVINKRREGAFMTDYRPHVSDGARIALRAFRRLQIT